ncbi:MAG: right-handed parallel beta-helix repeat-containing protein, partial [Tepidisphaerales bacterium]
MNTPNTTMVRRVAQAAGACVLLLSPRNVRSRRRISGSVWRLAMELVRATGDSTGRGPLHAAEPLEERRLLSIPGFSGIPEWSSGSVPELQNGNMIVPDQNNPVSGAVNALVPIPTDPNTLYAATVNGGIWVTHDALATDPYSEGAPYWVPLTDRYPSLSFGALALDPSDATNNTLWAGYARTSSGGLDGEGLNGLLKTTDGGSTWVPLANAPLGAPGGLKGQSISSIVPTTQIGPTTKKQIVLVATWNYSIPVTGGQSGGVWRSNDGGQTFTNLSAAAGLPLNAGVSELIADPANPNQFYAAIPGFGVYRSTNNQGAQWVQVNTGLSVAGSLSIKLSIYNNGGSNAVYAGLIFPAPPNGTDPTLVYRSTNSGGNWTQIGGAINVNPGNQAGNLAVLADRNNANGVYVSGDRQPNGPFDANIQYGDASNNNWNSVVDGGANNTSPHADSRDMAWAANGDLFFACDGGVYRMINVGTSNNKWQGAVGTLEAHEVYSVAFSAWGGIIFGNQDTGTAETEIPNAQFGSTFTLQDCTSGDGNVVAVDETSQPGTTYVYSSGNSFLTFQYQTFTGVEQLSGTTQLALTVDGTTALNSTSNGQFNFDTTIPFVPPYLLNTVNPARMIIGTNYLYESTDRGNTLNLLNGPLKNNLPDPTTAISGGIVPLVYGGTSGGVANASLIYAASGNRLYVRTSGSGMPAQVTYPTFLGAIGIRALAVDATNYNTAWAVDVNGHVYKTTDAGATLANWSDVTGDLGTLATDLRCITVYRSGANVSLLVGGAGGVFFTNAAGPTFHWREFGNFLPEVIVKDLYYYAPQDFLLAGTWGRGVWSVSNVSTFLNGAATTLNVKGDNESPAENDVFTMALDPNIPNLLDIKIEGGGKTHTYGVETTGIDTINIAGGGGNDTYNIQDVPAGISLNIDVGSANAVVNISKNGNTGTIIGPVNIGGDVGTPSSTKIVVDDQNDPYFGNTVNVSTGALLGGVTGLSPGAITYVGSAHVDSVYLNTSQGGANQINVTATGAATYINANRANNGALYNVVNIGSAGSAQSIAGPLTLCDPGNEDIISVNAASDPPVAFTLKQTAVTGDTPFGQIINLSPGLIGFRISDTGGMTIATSADPAAVLLSDRIFSPGVKGLTVSKQAGLTVQGWTLPNGFDVTGTTGLHLTQNSAAYSTLTDDLNSTLDNNTFTQLILTNSTSPILSPNNTITGNLTVDGGRNATITSNSIGSLTLKGGTHDLQINNNTVSGTVVVGSGGTIANNASFNGNTVSGATTVTGGSGLVFNTNTTANVTLTGATAPSLTGNTINGDLLVNGGTSAPTLSGNKISGKLTIGDATPTNNANVQNNTITGDVTLNGGTNEVFNGNSMGSLTLQGGASNLTITNNTITGALTLQGPPMNNVTITGNSMGSLLLNATVTGTSSISLNDIGGVPQPPLPHFGVSPAAQPSSGGPPPITMDLEAPFGGPINFNNVHGGTIGVNYAVPEQLISNHIYSNTTGVVMPINSTSGGLGFFPGSGTNEIYNNTIGVNLTGLMQLQHIYSNTTGVIGSGILGGSSLDTANIIETNTTGVDFAGIVQFNRIDRNATGILAHNAQVVVHNVIYRNMGAGVRTSGATDLRIDDNTFYQTAGNGVQVDGGSSRVELLNNVFQADGGTDVYVADDSRSGFFSDYNDLYSTGTGKIFHYISDFTDILDLQRDINLFDLHSIGTSAVNPTYAQPRFANLAADDYHIAPPSAGQHASSPTVDAADPLTDLMLPTAYHNLLANSSFESGTASWNVNVGGTTQSLNPPAWDGTSYFYSGAVAAGFAEQTVSLSAAGLTPGQLDAQNLALVFGGRVRSAAETPPDQGKLILTFLDGSGNVLGPADTVSASNVSDRWELLGDRLHMPVGARSVKYRFESLRQSGSTDDSYLDGAFLYVLPDNVAPDQGAYGNTDAGEINLSAPHIQLLTPQLYVDWEPNQPHNITWATFNGGGSPVRIDLYQDSGGTPQLLANITTSTPDTGSFTWIPQNFGLTWGTFGLRIGVSLVGTPSASDLSSETFAIPENTHTYYVNDNSTAGDQYTTAVGSNRNTGRLPSEPKPLLSTLLEDYALGSGDIVYIDTGVYQHIGSTVISGNPAIGNAQGVTIIGPTTAGSVAQISAPSAGPVFDINSGNFVTLSHLAISGGQYGVWVHNNSSNFTGAYLTLAHNGLDGIRMESDSSTNDVLDHIVSANNGRDGISIGGPGVNLTNSIAHNNVNAGIRYDNSGSVAVTGNQSYLNTYGIQISTGYGTGATVGNTDLTRNLGNIVHDNTTYGINASGPIVVAGNTVFGTGTFPGTNTVGINLQGGASATENVVYNNYQGIYSNSGGTAGITNNRVFDTAGTGIYAANSTTATGNVIYSNVVGLEGDSSPTWSNNLIYAESVAGIWLHSGFSANIFNNTIYLTTGDGIRIESSGGNFSFQHVNIRNNIVWTQNGTDLTVTPQAEINFQSDYNDLYTTGNGQVGLWEGVTRPTIQAWRLASYTDFNSISANPQFVNPAGADGKLGFTSNADYGTDDDFHEQSIAGSFHGGALAPAINGATGLPASLPGTLTADLNTSPAVDRGDAASSFANEPSPNGGFINLGAYGNTTQASESTIPYVLVLSPNGGETIVEGETFNITWRSEVTTGTVAIDLMNGNSVVQNVATGVPNSGSYAWSVPAAITPGSYTIRVSRTSPSPSSGISAASFNIVGPVHTFYVNDGTFQAGDFTTAAGDDANNSGLDPAHPKASIRAILQAYNLLPGDVIDVDAGNYTLSNNIVVPATRSGIIIRGFYNAATPTHVAVINRNGTTAGSYVFDIQGATGVTLDHLTLVGGDIGVNLADNAGATGFTLSNSEVYGSATDGIYIGAANNGALIAGDRVHDIANGYAPTGIDVRQAQATISNNTIYNNTSYNVYVSNGNNTTISGNTVYNSSTGIYADTSTISGNIAYNNLSAGIVAGSGAVVTGNTTYNNTGSGYPQAGIQVYGGTLQGNISYGNVYGILVSGSGTITGNLLYNNTTDGAAFGNSTVFNANVVYGNGWGVVINSAPNAAARGPSLSNNLIYGNASGGIQLIGGDITPIDNNTIYQTTGDAIDVTGAPYSTSVDIRNNILWVTSGYDLRIDPSAQSGVTGDYNDLYATGTGKIGLWQNVSYANLNTWQLIGLLDAHSISADPLFVNATGGDFHEQSLYGSFHGGSLAPVLNVATGLPVPATATLTSDASQSPAIDSGDASFAYANEPAPNGGYINLGAYGNTAQASESPSAYVLVTQPSGGQTWIEGQTYTVTWRDANIGTGLVNIDLMTFSGGTPTLQSNIVTGVTNSGHYTWIPSGSIPPGSNYLIRVTQQGGPSALSPAVFSLAAQVHTYYVNDATVQAGDWTTAPGNDANSGLDPAHPKASITSVLASYTLTSLDTIMVDEGTYNLTNDITLLPTVSGVTIEGYDNPSFPARQAVLNRGNTTSGACITLDGAANVTIDHLVLTGALYGFQSTYQVASNNAKVTNCVITGNASYGVYLLGGADNFTLNNDLIHDNDGGLSANYVANITVTNNTLYNHRLTSLGISSNGGLVSGNQVYNTHNAAAIGVSSGGSGASGLVTVTNNVSHDNTTTALSLSGDVLATGNTTYNNTGAIGINVAGGEARGNLSYNNNYGIYVSSGLADQNKVYNNSYEGIYVGSGTVTQNQVYSNPTGIEGNVSPTISNNLVYANTTRGIYITAGVAAQVINNTVYQPTGDALDLLSSEGNFQFQHMQVRNNILWAQAGYDLNLTDDAAIGFFSDYNDLYVTGTGKVARISNRDYPALSDWVYEYGYDTHSISADPKFVNVAGANFHLLPASPAIDAGDPALPYLNEPAPNGGRINLGNFGNTTLADPSPAAQSVQITSPSNLQKLEAGHQYTLSWQTNGVTANQPVLLVDTGGPAVGYWTADAFSTTSDNSRTVTNTIDTSGVSNPAPQQVYQSYVWPSSGSELAYQLPVPDGNYTLRLHFMQDVSYIGKSVFDIKVNGVVVKSAYDLFASAGAGYKAAALSFNVNASGGKGFLVEVVAVSGYPVLSGIELTAPNPTPVASPTANLQVSTDSGNTWTTIATNQPIDAYGHGNFPWTPAVTTSGPTALFRVSINNTSLTGTSPPFAIYNGGTDYYVNDASQAGDAITTAIGNNANSGKAPNAPLADIQAVLTQYNPGAGATIHVDTGTYVLVHNLTLTAANSGLKIQGPATAAAVINRANTVDPVISLTSGADNITLDHLSITGGSYGIFSDYYNAGTAAINNVVSNNQIYGNNPTGLFLGSSNTGWLITGNTFHDNSNGGYQGKGIDFESSSGTVTNNKVFNESQIGILVSGGAGSTISGNETYADGTGIQANGALTISNNLVHDNATYGIYVSGGALVTGNNIYRQTATNAIGIYLQGAEARSNVVYYNYNGIVGSNYSTNTIDRNDVYSNTNFGIWLNTGTGVTIENLVYANSAAGIVLTSSTGEQIANNTVYQLVGDALRFTASPNASIHSNILWVEAGDDLDFTDAASQAGLVSDYNDLYRGLSASAHVGFWGATQDQLSNWQGASANDTHSISANPQFLSAKGADQVLGYSTAGSGYNGGGDDNFYLAAGSPAIDRGYTWAGYNTDILNQPRADDPGTTNAGSNNYVPADQGSSQYAVTGTATGWRSSSGY